MPPGSFLRRRRPEAEAAPGDDTSAGTADLNGDDGPRPAADEPHGGPAVMLWRVPASSVEAVLAHPAFSRRLTTGLVLVHDKRPTADLLLARAAEIHFPDVRYTTARESAGGLDELVDGLCLARTSRSSRPHGVTVLHSDAVPTAVPAALVRLAAAPGLRRGVWVRGHVRDLHPAHLRLFDVMFLFDMSDADMETLRTSVPVPDDRAARMRQGVGADDRAEAVLVVTAGSHRLSGARVQEISDNPAVLPLRDGWAVHNRDYRPVARS